MEWQGNRLPDDELCIENAIMLERYNRYPLIVDPSGQATEFILKQYADKKIAKGSKFIFKKICFSCLSTNHIIIMYC